MKRLITALMAASLFACANPPSPTTSATSPLSASDSAHLQRVLDAQSAETQARFDARHPKETLEFFAIKPGMTVVEVLPGGGWYSGILGPYLGPEGTLIAADYPLEIFQWFDWATPAFIEKRAEWGDQWQAGSASWPGGEPAKLKAFSLSTLPTSLDASVDSVLFIRALHNLSNFEDKGGFRTKALTRAYQLLKPGGTLGIVQHQAPESYSDEWASGARAYLKKSSVIKAAEQAGFRLLRESDINENPKDKPGLEDSVWRLPPSLGTSKDDPELRAKYQAIGESNRMTLLFVKD